MTLKISPCHAYLCGEAAPGSAWRDGAAGWRQAVAAANKPAHCGDLYRAQPAAYRFFLSFCLRGCLDGWCAGRWGVLRGDAMDDEDGLDANCAALLTVTTQRAILSPACDWRDVSDGGDVYGGVAAAISSTRSRLRLFLLRHCGDFWNLDVNAALWCVWR